MTISGRYISWRGFAAGALGTLGFAGLGKTAYAETALNPTPMQTMGPFYPVSRLAETDADLTMLKGHTAIAFAATVIFWL